MGWGLPPPRLGCTSASGYDDNNVCHISEPFFFGLNNIYDLGFDREKI
jgi:hypothetical protein